METTVKPVRENEGRGDATVAPPAPRRSAAEAAEHLEQTLAHFESMIEALEERTQHPTTRGAVPQELAELKQLVEELFQRIEHTLDRLGLEAQRLADGASDLAIVAGRLETKMQELPRALGGQAQGEREPEAAPPEPQFQPGDQAVGIVLAAVPGFQGLMDAQRALNGLPQAASASVVAYKNGEASLEVVLREPVSARRIVEGLRESTGHSLLIEESRPEAQRLRLRFIERGGSAST